MISALSFLNLQNNCQNFVLLDSSEFPAWPSSELVSVELPLAVAAAAVVVVVAAVVLAVVFAVVVVAMAICNAIASVVALRMIPEEKASFCFVNRMAHRKHYIRRGQPSVRPFVRAVRLPVRQPVCRFVGSSARLCNYPSTLPSARSSSRLSVRLSPPATFPLGKKQNRK